MVLLRASTRARRRTGGSDALDRATASGDGAETVVVEVHDLVRRFGNFTAVDHVSFEVRRGEIFGLLGPNGAGKTTTFRMLCGLLPATGGTLRVAGVDLRTRARVGAAAHRLCGAEVLALRPAYGGREPRFLRQRLRPARRAASASASTGRCSQFELSRSRTLAERATARRLQAAAGHGGGAAARAGDPVPRRADQRRRSAGAARVLAADHRAGRAGRDRDRHHPLHGGGRILRPRRHPGRRPGAGPRHARRDPRPRAEPRPAAQPTMEDAFIAIVRGGADRARRRARPHEARTSAAQPDTIVAPSFAASGR